MTRKLSWAERWLNPDGRTYNGVRMFSDLSGLSSDEISWSFARLRHLMQVGKLSREEAVASVRRESESKPWLKREAQAKQS